MSASMSGPVKCECVDDDDDEKLDKIIPVLIILALSSEAGFLSGLCAWP